jgi:hypothetical protein
MDMAVKTGGEKPKRSGGPRAPLGKKPLMVIMDERLIKKAKHAAVDDDCKVSHIVEKALTEWLAKPRKAAERKTV